jgi:8-oxo-dGTP diphosphatase
MPERYRSCVDVHLILRQGDRVLLGERQNTGFADGYYHLPSGHLEADESATDALVREAEEEIKVGVDSSDVVFVHLMHHQTNEGRVALFFEVTKWRGQPTNCELTKCVGLNWFDLDSLPERIVPYAGEALKHYATGTKYSECGWHEAGDDLPPTAHRYSNIR